MRLAIGYSTKNQVELTQQTLRHDGKYDLFWCDGSTEPEAIEFFRQFSQHANYAKTGVRGGADAAIAWKLTKVLQAPVRYSHIMLLENDVLLDEDWLAPTMELFDLGAEEGLHVGAVSPRAYADRVLVQRDDFACMHNLGAGVIVFTREAAEIILRTFRTHWWANNVCLFAQLAGVDLRMYAAFRGNEQPVTTDWGWEAQLAARGLASLALTPARCTMIGQNPPLEAQGLELATGPVEARRDDAAFERYREGLIRVREGSMRLPWSDVVQSSQGAWTYFPHQLGCIAGGAGWQGTLELVWSQGHGPFAYRAGPGGACLSVHISGICSFLVAGGPDGVRVVVTDHRSGFTATPQLWPEAVAISVPGSPVGRRITLEMAEGAAFYGLVCNDEQPQDRLFSFEWSQLPPAPETR